jgi:hypothetical protein
MNLNQIHSVVAHFYQAAIHDIWIGYHFKHITDLSPHIDRIARFWYFQYHQKKVAGFEHEQFNLIHTHMPLQATTGQLNRWIILFNQSLETAVKDSRITSLDQKWWMDLIMRFKEIFLKNDGLFR